MTVQTGTYDISTLLAARNQSVAQFGMNTVADILAADIAAHNAIVNGLLQELCEMTTDRQRIYGTSVGGEMFEVDEYSRVPTQKAAPSAQAAFPLRLFQYGIGWTRKFLENATPYDLAIRTQAAEKAHLKAVQLEIKKALFLSANYTFNDHLVDKVDLAVKRLINADSSSIPEGPNGETFDGSTHTHYLARAGGALALTDIDGLITHVVEHGHGARVVLAINRANESGLKTLMSTAFYPYLDARLTPGTSSTYAAANLDTSRIDNRAIGLYGAAEVWVKSWVPSGYYVAYDAGSPMKPLVFRQRATTAGMQGLRVAAEFDAFPLQAQYMEAEFGIGVWTRTNGAVLLDAAAYADPSL